MNNTIIINNNLNSVFDGWDDYQFHILFSFWNVQNPWHLGLSCIGLLLGCISLHLLKMLREHIKTKIRININKKLDDIERQHLLIQRETTSQCCLYFGYLITTILLYTILILLTLATTTFNPWIVTTIIFGYTIGDILIIEKSINNKIEQSYL